ncbi:MAG: hypothetical protein HOP10_13610 [Chitinophagaceae bacterium]|nr:hypothetical protein [Chitinophagaceae bacterium]
MIKNIAVLWTVLLTGCGEPGQPNVELKNPTEIRPRYGIIEDIQTPAGYKRLDAPEDSFGAWLRRLSLKENKTVYLFNGSVKPNQLAQFAVLDITTGDKDLQQCADAVMRLRAEYLFATKKFDSICFIDYNGKKYQWSGDSDRTKFGPYLENVFGWCGSASLEKQLKPVPDYNSIQIGDVLIRGGFPGHAVLVTDMAINEKGEKIYLLVQGYQPAQDMHVLVNPVDNSLSPWYKVTDSGAIYTPEWTFERSQLRRW